MNTKIVVPGVCLAGAALVAVGMLKKNADASAIHETYLKEVANYNSLPATERGQADVVYRHAAELKAQLEPEKTKKINDLKILVARAKDDREKIVYLRQAVDIDPDNDLCLGLLATYLEKTGDFKGAKDCYLKIIQVSKFDSEVKTAKKELEKLNGKERG